MAELTFIYGTMESGKTTKLLQDNYNYRKHGHKTILVKPLIDTKGGTKVINRTNDYATVDICLSADESLLSLEYLKIIRNANVILIDEAQFLKAKQVKELWEIAHILNITITCYGLKSDFRGNPFEGSVALYGLADRKTELTVNCSCGKTAVFNARLLDGNYILDGDAVAIDGEQNVTYEPLCSDCYLKKVIGSNEIKRIRSLKELAKKNK